MMHNEFTFKNKTKDGHVEHVHDAGQCFPGLGFESVFCRKRKKISLNQKDIKETLRVYNSIDRNT